MHTHAQHTISIRVPSRTAAASYECKAGTFCKNTSKYVNQHAAAISFMTCPTENDANERRDKVDLVNWIDGCRIMWRGDDTDGEPGNDMAEATTTRGWSRSTVELQSLAAGRWLLKDRRANVTVPAETGPIVVIAGASRKCHLNLHPITTGFVRPVTAHDTTSSAGSYRLLARTHARPQQT